MRPTLPEPACSISFQGTYGGKLQVWGASQVHAYADACVAAETAALRVELDDAESSCVAKQSEIDALRTLHHEQAARIKVLDQDAERYRWLRELPNADSLNVRFMGTDLDRVIDAEMLQSPLVGSSARSSG